MEISTRRFSRLIPRSTQNSRHNNNFKPSALNSFLKMEKPQGFYDFSRKSFFDLKTRERKL